MQIKVGSAFAAQQSIFFNLGPTLGSFRPQALCPDFFRACVPKKSLPTISLAYMLSPQSPDLVWSAAPGIPEQSPIPVLSWLNVA